MDGDDVNFMETAKIVAEVCEERQGRHLGVKGCGVLKFLELDLIHVGLHEGNAAFVGGIV